uniref:Putative ovule protein n=1 Tax=Solanum chacoense TaxID=4108 RepID=A0A0V0HZX1_SOLCH
MLSLYNEVVSATKLKYCCNLSSFPNGSGVVNTTPFHIHSLLDVVHVMYALGCCVDPWYNTRNFLSRARMDKRFVLLECRLKTFNLIGRRPS